MDVLLLGMEGSIPFQVIRMDLVRRGDIPNAGADQRTPVLYIL